MNEIMVSVWCLAYNHEKYIRDAIEGFLAQKTNFLYEIYIHDDASTDGTADIIREYENKYLNVIKGIYQKENLYSKTDSDWHGKKSILQKVSRGKYIALCEGDDFWIDNEKLQIQVDYMESHPQCMLITHNALISNCISKRLNAINPYPFEQDVAIESLIFPSAGSLPTASYLFRREILDMPIFFCNAGIGDFPLQLYSACIGNVHYFSRIMSVYRYMHDGSYTKVQRGSVSRCLKQNVKKIEFMQRFNEYTGRKYEETIIKRIRKFINEIINVSVEQNENEFKTICDDSDRELKYEYTQYISEIRTQYQKIKNLNYLDEEMKKFCKKYLHIVLWGIGEYGHLVANQLNNNGLSFDGFLVSDEYFERDIHLRESAERQFGKLVWKSSNIPFKKDEVGIIVCAKEFFLPDIIPYIEKEYGTQYYYPFSFNKTILR